MTEQRLVEDVLEKAPDAFRTISEVAEDLDLPQHVLRFWETRFSQIKPLKRGGNRRYYRPDDVDLLKGIRYYLYGEGYTIKGVQRILKERGQRHVVDLGRTQIQGYTPPVGKMSSNAAKMGTKLDEWPEPTPPLRRMPTLPDHLVPVAANEPVRLPRAVAGDLIRTPTQPTAAPSTQTRSMGREEVRRLQAALFELSECRRILDAAHRDAKPRH